MIQQNDAVELELEFSNVKFHARGSQSWVDKKLDFFLTDERFIKPVKARKNEPLESSDSKRESSILNFGEFKVGSAAERWLKKSEITLEILEHVFHSSGDELLVVAAEVPGKSKREQTLNAYRLEGARNFLHSDSQTFSNEAARELCEKLGCYDRANHSKYMKGFGNHISGSKKSGYTLTAPGLKAAALVIIELAGVIDDN